MVSNSGDRRCCGTRTSSPLFFNSYLAPPFSEGDSNISGLVDGWILLFGIFDRILFTNVLIFFLVSSFFILDYSIFDFRFASRVGVLVFAVARLDIVAYDLTVDMLYTIGGEYLFRLNTHVLIKSSSLSL